MLVDRRMLMVMPSMIWNATSVAIYSGTFVELMAKTMNNSFSDWSNNKMNMYALFAMIFFGIGEIIGSFV